MKIRNNKLTGTCLGITLALAGAASALADDTELLLVNPDPATAPKPNVMFILDTSGSMTSIERTAEPYDSTITYAGACDINSLYWTDVDISPDCSTTNQRIDKSAFHCEYANRQVDGIGSFTNTMVQYNNSGSPTKRWDYLQPGNATDPVECQSDSGQHGDGTANYLWASRFSGLSNPWTNNSSREVSWGSAPRNLAYTVFDGNYLNWRNTPALVDLSRIDILKKVTTTVLNSVDNMNVGVMRFAQDEGGAVIEAVQDLETNRTDLINTINALPAAGATPVSETFYESARYWLGEFEDYGGVQNVATDPAALASTGPDVYKQPVLESCAKNYNVLITDGGPNDDEEGDLKGPTLPGFATVLGRTVCDGTGVDAGVCLDDVAEYLSKVDTASTVDGVQTVTTHTIGYNVDLDILEDAAARSGGDYFLADDVQSLTIALLRIVADINDRSLSFSAPAVSVNTFNRTRNLNDVYLTVFRARNAAHWPGNLKKYSIRNGDITDALNAPAVDPSTGFFYETSRSFWTTGGADGTDVTLGGAARNLPTPASRKLFTNNGGNNSLSAAANALSVANAGAFTPADFGLIGAANEPSLNEMIDWMRGVDVRDEDNNALTTIRYAMGDPLHSRPAAVVYGGTETNPESVIFTATNDGYVHAIDGATGSELWSFVPKEVLPRMARLYFNPSAKYKQYGVDGNIVPVVKDVDQDGIIEAVDGDFVRIIFGMRRGGSTYYALDVTNKSAPVLMWQRTLTAGGQSWSTPVVTRMDIDTTSGPTLNADKAVVVIGGGYDPIHDTSAHPAAADAAGAGIHFLDLVTGQTLWRGGAVTGATKVFSTTNWSMNRAFATEIRVADLNGDRFADRMYASDMGGQVWRFDIVNGAVPAALVDGGVIAQLGAEGLTSPSAGDTRRFYNSPDISIFRDPVQGRRYVSVAIGSGYRAHPFDVTATDRFFALRDPNVFGRLDQAAYDSYDIITEADLVEVSGTVKSVIGPSADGWKFTLPANEKVLAESLTFNNEIFFVSFDPRAVGAANCGTGQGTNFLYRVSVVNGDPIVNNLDAIVPGDEDAERKQQLAQGGIAPAPTVVFPSPVDPLSCTGAACSPPPVVCVGVECSSPGFRNVPKRTLWTQEGIE